MRHRRGCLNPKTGQTKRKEMPTEVSCLLLRLCRTPADLRPCVMWPGSISPGSSSPRWPDPSGLLETLRRKQETQTLKLNPRAFGSTTSDLLLHRSAVQTLKRTRGVDGRADERLCWEKLRTPADFQTWLLSSDWTAGRDLHHRNVCQLERKNSSVPLLLYKCSKIQHVECTLTHSALRSSLVYSVLGFVSQATCCRRLEEPPSSLRWVKIKLNVYIFF